MWEGREVGLCLSTTRLLFSRDSPVNKENVVLFLSMEMPHTHMHMLLIADVFRSSYYLPRTWVLPILLQFTFMTSLWGRYSVPIWGNRKTENKYPRVTDCDPTLRFLKVHMPDNTLFCCPFSVDAFALMIGKYSHWQSRLQFCRGFKGNMPFLDGIKNIIFRSNILEKKNMSLSSLCRRLRLKSFESLLGVLWQNKTSL